MTPLFESDARVSTPSNEFDIARVQSHLERMTRFDYDVAVIGGGSGGYAAVRTTAAAGLRTVVIDGGREVGGLCILRGCMPTKALLYAAEVHHLAKHPEAWGIRPGRVTFDFKRVMARKNKLIQEFADDRRQQLTGGKFKFIRATAQFLNSHKLALSNGRELTARHFIISTGSAIAPSPLPALDEIGYLTSDEALTLARLPKSLIILGGGSVAIEFAQFFARFGVKVTKIQRGPHVLHDFDKDAATVIERVLRREGINLYTGTRLLDAAKINGRKQISFLHRDRKNKVSAEEVMFALGRIPSTSSLGLQFAGVATENGRIIANEKMQTSARHIYAAGDCTGPHEFVHLAVIQGELAAHNIARPRQPRLMDYRLLTSIVFTEPQVAVVGLTEKQAVAQKIPYLSASYPFADHGKSMIMEAKDGFVKLLANPKTGEIIGGGCVGPSGGELIHEIITAMANRMTVRDLANIPHYHPTLAEIWTYPAEELAARTGPGPTG
jgi:pyruvate/2-oxoglutarate dehydrogenase complex dihydrolipoamide dehydrogenase (E3) component